MTDAAQFIQIFDIPLTELHLIKHTISLFNAPLGAFDAIF